MKLCEGFRLKWSVFLVFVVVNCVSTAPNNFSPLVSSGQEALVITSTEFPNHATISGESGAVEPTEDESKVVKPEIQFFRIHSDIKYRYSRTYVTSRVVNLDSKRAQETTFRVVLPESAFISKFVLEIDGISYEAYVKEKGQAREVYQQAQRQGNSAGLVEVNTRNSNMFNVNVNIKPQSKVTFNLTYEELLSRKLGKYEQSINISPEQITSVKDFQIVVNIEESQNITHLRVPNLRNDVEAPEDKEGNNVESVIVRPGGNQARISWSPTQKNQEILADQGIPGKFVVQYDINRESNSGEILLMEGYFVHFFAPEDLAPLRKHVVFVLDISGSMSGRRIEQLKDSQKKILDDLSPNDFFNILTFSGGVSVWSPPGHDDIPDMSFRSKFFCPTCSEYNGPYPATKDNVMKAKAFIESLRPGGGTNIHDALMAALNQTKNIKDTRDEEGVGVLPPNVESLIIFLTDGQPTVGVTDPRRIQSFIHTANANLSIPIYSLGFGEGADFPFLKRLSLQNFGFARKIYEASDAAIQLKGFFNEIASPLLSKVAFNYTSNEYNVSQVTLNKFPTIFGGSEVVVAGKLTSVAPPYPSLSEPTGQPEFNYQLESSSVAQDNNVTQAEELLAVAQISPTDNDAPLRNPVNNLIVPKRDLLEVTISGSGREGVMEFDKPRLFCGFAPDLLNQFPSKPTPPASQEDAFLERFWAYLTIKQLIDSDTKDGDKSSTVETPNYGERMSTGNQIARTLETPKEQAIRLALKYNFVTPFTSLVVVKPNASEVTDTLPTDANKHQHSPRANARSRGKFLGASRSIDPHSLSMRYPDNPVSRSRGPILRSDVSYQRAIVSEERSRLVGNVPPASNLNISSIAWINPNYLVLKLNQTEFKIALNRTSGNDDEGKSCEIKKGLPGSPVISGGQCRHLRTCIQPEFINNMDTFTDSYFCPIKSSSENFVGVCCPLFKGIPFS